MTTQIDFIKPKATNILFPGVNIEIYVTNKEQSESEKNIMFLLATAKVRFKGGYVSATDPVLVCQDFNHHKQIQFSVFIPFTKETVYQIESVRKDDIELSLEIDALISRQYNEQFGFTHERLSYRWKHSQKEWSSLLKELGHDESWIFEIKRTNIEGMSVVVEHLNKALDEMHALHFEDCLTNVRISWNAIKPLLEENWTKIEHLIDEGSPGEAGQDSKSKRIKDIKDKIHKFSNVGVHREAYRVDPEDAILGYYLTLAMISYLSKLLNKVI